MTMYRWRRLSVVNLLGTILIGCLLIAVFRILTTKPYDINSRPRDLTAKSRDVRHFSPLAARKIRPRDVVASLPVRKRDAHASTKRRFGGLVQSTIKHAYGTTEKEIWTTLGPFTTTKYYTYVEDFLANWDKYQMSAEASSRTQAVIEAAIRIKNRTLFTPMLTPSQRNVVYDLLSSFDNMAKAEGIQYFIYGGTLLGSFRHHDIIPWDDDIDIIISDADRERLQDAVARSPMSFVLSTLSPEHFKLHNRYGQFTNLYHDWSYPYIDISFYQWNETHMWDVAVTYGRWWEYKLDDIFPLHPRPLGPLMVPAPRDTYKYLLDTYDLRSCSESYYSHQLEMIVRCRMVTTDCRLLPYAFVHRSQPSEGTGVNETLVENGEEIHWTIVEEPDYTSSISDPYTLRLRGH